jgi:hypothetical protein
MESPDVPSEASDLANLAASLADHLSRLDQVTIHRVRGIKATANCTAIVLEGNCNSFYSKSLAQEAARKFLGGRATIRNNILVRKELLPSPSYSEN